MPDTYNIAITVSGAGRLGAARREMSAMERSAQRIGSFLRSAFGALSVGLAVRELARLSDEFVNVQNRIRVIVTESEAFNRTYRTLFQVARNARTSLLSVGQVFGRLAQAFPIYNRTTADAVRVTGLLSRAVQVSGASAQEASAGLQQLAQGIASNRLSGDELRSVLENIPFVADLIAESLGVVRGQLRTLGEQGRLTGNVVIEAIELAADTITQRFANITVTISQALTTVRNAFVDYVGNANEATGVSTFLTRALLLLADNFRIIGDLLVVGTVGIGLRLLSRALSTLGPSIQRFGGTLDLFAFGFTRVLGAVSRSDGLFAGLFATIRGGARFIGRRLLPIIGVLATSWFAVGAAITTATFSLIDYVNQSRRVRALSDSIPGRVEQVQTNAGESIEQVNIRRRGLLLARSNAREELRGLSPVPGNADRIRQLQRDIRLATESLATLDRRYEEFLFIANQPAPTDGRLQFLPLDAVNAVSSEIESLRERLVILNQEDDATRRAFELIAGEMDLTTVSAEFLKNELSDVIELFRQVQESERSARLGERTRSALGSLELRGYRDSLEDPIQRAVIDALTPLADGDPSRLGRLLLSNDPDVASVREQARNNALADLVRRQNRSLSQTADSLELANFIGGLSERDAAIASAIGGGSLSEFNIRRGSAQGQRVAEAAGQAFDTEQAERIQRIYDNITRNLEEQRRLRGLTGNALEEERTILDLNRQIIEAGGDGLGEWEPRIRDAIRAQQEFNEELARADEIREAFASNFEDSITELVTTGRTSFRDLANSIFRDITRSTVRNFINPFLFGQQGTTGGGFLGSLIGLGGGQAGGIFTIPGSGPPDSAVFAARVTPGEQVALTPPGEQFGGNAGIGGGRAVVQNFNFPPQTNVQSLRRNRKSLQREARQFAGVR